MRQAKHVAYVGERRNKYKIFVRKLVGIYKHRWEDDTEMNKMGNGVSGC
jgi:hypothetical protein